MDAASFVAFLRMEADMSDDKAKRLRLQADLMAMQNGITVEMESSYELNPNELAPLDEFGIPKYKGRKRGRKPKKRKRALNPNRPKRQHTAYTLFVHEVYPTIRAQYEESDFQSKDIIALVARQWATTSEADKQIWKERALASHHDVLDALDVEEDPDEEEEDEDEEEEEENDVDVSVKKEEVEDVPARPKRGRPRKKV